MARLEILILLAIAAVVSTYQVPDWEDPFFVFRQYDTDRDGELNWIELSHMFPVPRQMVKAKGRKKHVKQITNLMKLYDEDRSGTLDPLEFVKVLDEDDFLDDFDD
ncbi:hypothetical protein HOLleu_35057 [Holothuria leucospilota]|uniref:EF-hand domain-containing protein n=1 Tax=Holothuria leucospilota TaxID=206669 RepID=A0A9Q0YM41_HOLLE|nr:hypothetical protein HOLleu_35057 [Holothuria leucospilota]